MRPQYYLTCVFVATLLAGCAHQKESTTTGAHKTALALPTANEHKMAAQLQESRKLHNSDVVSQLIQTAQKDPSNSQPLYSLGYLHMQNGIHTKNADEIKLAEIYLTEVTKQFPGNNAVLQSLYNIYYDNTLRNRDPQAFEKAKAVFIQLPESMHTNMNPPSLAKYAAVVAQQEQDKESNHQALREILLDAIHESPTTDTSYIQLAKLYREDRYFALALATLKLGEENISNSSELYQTIADTYNDRAEVNGCNYEHAPDIRKATQYYQLAIPLNSDNPTLHYSLSQSFFDQNLNQLGLHEANIALDLKSTGDNFSLNAQNFSMLGYHQQAMDLLQQALGKGYSLGDVSYHEIYMNSGDWKNAANGFSNYVKKREKFNVYDLIKSDIIAQQAQTQAWPIGAKVSTNNPWEKALYNFWTHKISAADLKELAHTSCEKTEYYFYTGYRDLIAGNQTLANSKFTAALNQNTYRFIERPLARLFLQPSK